MHNVYPVIGNRNRRVIGGESDVCLTDLTGEPLASGCNLRRWIRVRLVYR